MSVVLEILSKVGHFNRQKESLELFDKLKVIWQICSFVEGNLNESAKRILLKKSAHKDISNMFGNISKFIEPSFTDDSSVVSVAPNPNDFHILTIMLELGIAKAKSHNRNKQVNFKIKDIFEFNLNSNNLKNCLKLSNIHKIEKIVFTNRALLLRIIFKRTIGNGFA